MTTLNVRIDETPKKKAAKTLAGLGLDMSGAIKLFLNQVVRRMDCRLFQVGTLKK